MVKPIYDDWGGAWPMPPPSIRHWPLRLDTITDVQTDTTTIGLPSM